MTDSSAALLLWPDYSGQYKASPRQKYVFISQGGGYFLFKSKHCPFFSCWQIQSGPKKTLAECGCTTIRMAELGHNFKIQREKLFQELKAAFPSVPDPAVRQVMKQVDLDKFLIILKTVWIISIYQTQLQVNAYISERAVFVLKVIHNSMPWLSLLTVSSCESTQASWLVRRRIFNFLLPSKEKEKVY